MRLYTEPQDQTELAGEAPFKHLCGLIEKRLPPKAYARVVDFIEYPLASVDLTGSILVELYRVFNAKNTFFSFQVAQEAKSKKIAQLIKDLDVHQYIIETGKEVLKNKPNTIVVIDKDANGEPYIVTVESERIIDAEINPDGSCGYIAFIHSETPQGKKIAVYDEENYTVVLFDSTKQEYTIETQTPHKIGYCPARCFIKSPVNKKSAYKRKIPLTSTVGKIREWQLFNIYKYYTEHYSAFPVVEKPKTKCSNPDCVNGHVLKDFFYEDGQRKDIHAPCPICTNDTVGIGTIIKIAPKVGTEDNGANVFKFIAPEITGVKYLDEKLGNLEKYIELKTIGQNNLITKEAVNVDQVKGSFQSREAVLQNLKETLEEIYIWIVETSARAFYLGDVEITVFANFGNEFYLIDVAELVNRFNEAVKANLPDAEISAIYQQMITTKYKDNPDEINRMELTRLLDPLPFKNFDTAKTYYEMGLLTQEEFIVKSRLLSFIDRFEMEQADLVIFGKNLSLAERIQKIKSILISYTNEYKKPNNPEPVQ